MGRALLLNLKKNSITFNLFTIVLFKMFIVLLLGNIKKNIFNNENILIFAVTLVRSPDKIRTMTKNR